MAIAEMAWILRIPKLSVFLLKLLTWFHKVLRFTLIIAAGAGCPKQDLKHLKVPRKYAKRRTRIKSIWFHYCNDCIEESRANDDRDATVNSISLSRKTVVFILGHNCELVLKIIFINEIRCICFVRMT